MAQIEVGRDQFILEGREFRRLLACEVGLKRALRQWQMYAEMEEGRDLKTEKSPEAALYREVLAISSDHQPETRSMSGKNGDGA